MNVNFSFKAFRNNFQVKAKYKQAMFDHSSYRGQMNFSGERTVCGYDLIIN